MNADREPNRLPLRAGAMLLFAVAVVFIGLGWHSAATSGEEPPAAQPLTTPTSTAPASSTTTPASTAKRVCVINAGQVTGLAGTVSQQLESRGYEMAQPGNYTAGGFSENTIFYTDDADKAQADEVAKALGGEVSVEERPSTFTRCRGGIPVIMVTEPAGS